MLTAALARLRGQPARVVVGLALISQDTDHQAFGHAWTEMLEGDKWVVADAALRGHTYIVRYLPLSLIEDEGIGYRWRWLASRVAGFSASKYSAAK